MDTANDKTRVFGVILFALVGVSALILGVIQAKNRITSPFAVDPAAMAAARAALEGAPIDKTKDTDADGISDYEETFVFHTSAYIKDSDSDGITDKAEIDRGLNPNCPEGKDCGMTPPPTAPGSGGTPTGDLLDLDTGTDTSVGTSAPATADEIRQILLNSGISAEMLSSISDEELLKLYAESAAETANANQ